MFCGWVQAEIVEAVVALPPKPLKRALELTGGHMAQAEDAVGYGYLAFCEKPPRTACQHTSTRLASRRLSGV
jgi:hypothetical protein